MHIRTPGLGSRYLHGDLKLPIVSATLLTRMNRLEAISGYLIYQTDPPGLVLYMATACTFVFILARFIESASELGVYLDIAIMTSSFYLLYSDPSFSTQLTGVDSVALLYFTICLLVVDVFHFLMSALTIGATELVPQTQISLPNISPTVTAFLKSLESNSRDSLTAGMTICSSEQNEANYFYAWQPTDFEEDSKESLAGDHLELDMKIPCANNRDDNNRLYELKESLELISTKKWTEKKFFSYLFMLLGGDSVNSLMRLNNLEPILGGPAWYNSNEFLSDPSSQDTLELVARLFMCLDVKLCDCHFSYQLYQLVLDCQRCVLERRPMDSRRHVIFAPNWEVGGETPRYSIEPSKLSESKCHKTPTFTFLHCRNRLGSSNSCSSEQLLIDVLLLLVSGKGPSGSARPTSIQCKDLLGHHESCLEEDTVSRHAFEEVLMTWPGLQKFKYASPSLQDLRLEISIDCLLQKNRGEFTSPVYFYSVSPLTWKVTTEYKPNDTLLVGACRLEIILPPGTTTELDYNLLIRSNLYYDESEIYYG